MTYVTPALTCGLCGDLDLDIFVVSGQRGDAVAAVDLELVGGDRAQAHHGHFGRVQTRLQNKHTSRQVTSGQVIVDGTRQVRSGQC